MVYGSNLLFIVVTFRVAYFLAAVLTAIFLVVILVIFVVVTFNVLESVVVFKVRQRLDFRLETSIREGLDKVLCKSLAVVLILRSGK